MSYTRLSMNFQPKTALYARRQVLLGAAAALSCWESGVFGAGNAVAATASTSVQAAPSMRQPITTKDGTAFTLDTLRGQPVLINFWASWCAPCIAEMPSLQKAAEQLQPDGIVVLLVSLDRGGAKKSLPVLAANGVTAPRLGFDPKAALSREMGVSGLPTSFLLSADQRHCLVYVGPREWHENAMQDEMRRFVSSPGTFNAA